MTCRQARLTNSITFSLKYHRLHPEYIYTRIRNLQGRYNLRILLTMVDIPNHEDSLRELSKTSLVNNVTVILCWSAAEAARYLELYKSYEHAGPAAIRGQQATGYAERLVEFVTVPRSINKADAVALVSSFGSLKNAINADQERIAVVGGWGEKKVKSWKKAVEEPFRVRKAARRRAANGGAGDSVLDRAVPIGRVPARATQQYRSMEDSLDEDTTPTSRRTATQSASQPRQPRKEDHLSDGVAAALARLREGGG
jgi:DNA excision repair protein ERCC-1